MDPYKVPESNLSVASKNMPKSISLCFGFIVLSFSIFLVEELFYAAGSEGGLFDFYNYLFVPIWGGVLYWVSASIWGRKQNPKGTFLLLAILVAGMSIYSPLGEYSIYTGLGEAACFLVVYFALNSKESKEWFS